MLIKKPENIFLLKGFSYLYCRRRNKSIRCKSSLLVMLFQIAEQFESWGLSLTSILKPSSLIFEFSSGYFVSKLSVLRCSRIRKRVLFSLFGLPIWAKWKEFWRWALFLGMKRVRTLNAFLPLHGNIIKFVHSFATLTNK